jgi:lycopene beta-cyclase
MQFFDYIITGSNPASLSLALHMTESPLREKRILILSDISEEQQNPSLTYWTKQSHHTDEIPSQTWTRARFVSRSGERELGLGAYHLSLIRGADFRSHVTQKLNRMPAVEWATGRIERIYDAAGQARVKTSQEEYSANWVFDGFSQPDPQMPDKNRFIRLVKQIKGWEIETGKDSFSADLPTLADFRTSLEGRMCFLQVFPFSTQRALVKFNVFSPVSLPEETISKAIQEYLADVLNLQHFDILAEENQVIRFSDQPISRRDGFRILRIGQAGGLNRPASGLPLQRLQRDSAEICASLLQTFHPFKLSRIAARYRLFDSAMLRLFIEQGESCESIVNALSKRHSIEQFLRFLDEESTWQEDFQLLVSLPWTALLRAAIGMDLFHKV